MATFGRLEMRPTNLMISKYFFSRRLVVSLTTAERSPFEGKQKNTDGFVDSTDGFGGD